MTNKLTIVITTSNRKELFENLIKSIKSQTQLCDEIVVIEDSIEAYSSDVIDEYELSDITRYITNYPEYSDGMVAYVSTLECVQDGHVWLLEDDTYLIRNDSIKLIKDLIFKGHDFIYTDVVDIVKTADGFEEGLKFKDPLIIKNTTSIKLLDSHDLLDTTGMIFKAEAGLKFRNLLGKFYVYTTCIDLYHYSYQCINSQNYIRLHTTLVGSLIHGRNDSLNYLTYLKSLDLLTYFKLKNHFKDNPSLKSFIYEELVINTCMTLRTYKTLYDPSNKATEKEPKLKYSHIKGFHKHLTNLKAIYTSWMGGAIDRAMMNKLFNLACFSYTAQNYKVINRILHRYENDSMFDYLPFIYQDPTNTMINDSFDKALINNYLREII